MKYPTTSNKLKKLAKLIQFTLKLICFSFLIFLSMFVIYIGKDVYVPMICAFLLVFLMLFVIEFLFFTEWEDLFKNDKK